MKREPWFWREDSVSARIVAAALSPLSLLYQTGAGLRRAFTQETGASAPVICIGNVTSGGVGKTPFSIALQQLLKDHGKTGFFATRGYGGNATGPLEVDPKRHGADLVGDEPLLLVAEARTWVAKKRGDGVRAAAAAGADIVIMDDGFQNPTIKKNLSFLLISNEDPFGNGRTLPAGPLREPAAAAIARADAIIAVAQSPKDKTHPGILAAAGDCKLYRCWLQAAPTIEPQPVVAFAGIGRPTRFFDLLRTLGFEVTAEYAFPDHHPFSAAELQQLNKAAADKEATLITTGKDYVRLPEAARADIGFLPVRMKIETPNDLFSFISDKLF